MEPINIRLPEVKIQKINEIATRNGITRSEVIRHALTIYFQLLENLGGFIDLRSLKISPNGISTSKWGDLIIMKLKNGQAFVLANTSSGGIGPKHEDEIKFGIGSEKELKIGKSLKNDLIVAVGEPKVGYEVIDALNANARDIIMVEDVLKLSKMAYVHEIIPVGHEGIKGGLKMMENIGGYRYKMETGIEEGLKVDIEKSAGPSTAIILTLEEENIEEVKRRIKKPFQVLGRIL